MGNWRCWEGLWLLCWSRHAPGVEDIAFIHSPDVRSFIQHTCDKGFVKSQGHRKEQMGLAVVRSPGTSFLLWVSYKHGEACTVPTGPGQLAGGRTEEAGARLQAGD